ncbi:MAG: hypothetical protein M1449_04790 [Candidatus Thermoplasmatota archaeon]|nr:hypothetical protein [Candidatus Thermoplasmatota archaeon]
MAAVGALAAGVAHEIGNPIAAMSGVVQEMGERFPLVGASLAESRRAMARAAANPSESERAALSAELLNTKNKLAQRVEQYRQKQKATAEHFRAQCDSVAMTSLLLGLFGVSLLGAIIGLFFTRLTNDLHTLENQGAGDSEGRPGPGNPG